MDELKLDLERRLREQCFALGNTERLSILSEIQKKPRTVTDILKDVKITQSTLSHQVKSKFVCKLLLGTCGAKGCLASLS